MKKFLILLGGLLLAFIGFLVYDSVAIDNIPILEIEESSVTVDELYIYGTHLNMSGSYNFTGEAELVLYNGQFISYDINSEVLENNIVSENGENATEVNTSSFDLSAFVNDGIYLDEIPIGNYYLFLRVEDTSVENENEEEVVWKYYPLKNNTEYQETTYYSMSNYEKKIVIENEDSYPTMMMNIQKVKNDDVYDVVIDPGHGGRDGGASKYGYKETDFTLDIATEVKNRLEELGLKVKLTHEIGQLSNTEKLEEYGTNGRAVIPREVNAKYLFSIHLNSSIYSSVNGLEVYTAKNINYDFANLIVNNLITYTGLNYSNSQINKVDNGIYSRSFTEDDIRESMADYAREGVNAYNITTRSNYYYIIRETGGIITGAYVDDRNEDILANPYVKSNIGTEAYLLEIGYISNRSDLDNVINNEDKYIEAIVNSIRTLYEVSE